MYDIGSLVVLKISHSTSQSSFSSGAEPRGQKTDNQIGSKGDLNHCNMNNGSNHLRRTQQPRASISHCVDSDDEDVDDYKKAPKSILSLSCQRFVVRFLAARTTGQVIMTMTAIILLILLPTTFYFMGSLSVSGYKKIRKRRRHRHGQHRFGEKPHFARPDSQENNVIYDRYDIESDDALKGFDHRTTFHSLQPRIVGLTDDLTNLFQVHSSFAGTFVLPDEGWRELKTRYVPLRLKNPKVLSQAESLWKNGCEPLDASWQDAYHPTCNVIHEASGGWQQVVRIPAKIDKDESEDNNYNDMERTRLINQGAFRHVWMIRDAHDGMTKRAMKTLRSLKRKEKDFDLRNHDRHRRDAMSFEVLSDSPLVVDLYASCSNTAIFDYADRGDLLGIFDKEESPGQSEEFNLHLMEIAYNVSLSVHDAHHFDSEGRATMAHTDIKTDQFIFQDGYYKLSDFNRVRFLSWNPKTRNKCKFTVGKNGGEYRAPEEYAYKEENEKVDVYSLGNVLYFLLTREEVWKGFSNKQVYDLVMKGKRPLFPDSMKESEGIFETYMIKAIEAAWIHKPDQRPGALEVAKIIEEGILLKKKSLELPNSKQ